MGCLRRVLPHESLAGYSSWVPRSETNEVDNYEIMEITNAERSTGQARCMIGDLSQRRCFFANQLVLPEGQWKTTVTPFQSAAFHLFVILSGS